MTALATRGVALKVGGSKGRVVLSGLNLSVNPGECVAIVGENGAGKSTLLRALAGVERVSQGAVFLGNRELGRMKARELARMRAYLGQREDVGFDYSVEEVVLMGAYARGGAWSLGGEEQSARVRDALSRVELEGYASRSVLSLSGGELQRVMMARVVLAEATWWMLDEPLVGLDIRHQERACALFRKHCDEGGAVIWVCHDLNWVWRVCDRVWVCNGGEVCADGAPEDVLTEELIERVFGVKVEFLTGSRGDVIAFR